MTDVPAFLEARRSIRAFRPEPVDPDLLDTLVTAACLAPAPHHSRPWRWVVVDTPDAKAALATGMGERWRSDLARDGLEPARIDALVDASHRRIEAAPAVVLGCLTDDGLDHYPDEARQRAEWGMALLALGAAVENLMLAATEPGTGLVLGGSPDLLSSRGPHRHCDSTTDGSPTPWSSWATPTRRTSRVPDRRSSWNRCAPGGDQRPTR